ncbi:MAG: lipase maturation factor family protein [Candidatus Latescibacterota bacterium]|jgi:hypothetical protein
MIQLRAFLNELPRVENEWITPLDPASYGLARFFLLRLLGFVYALAFFSLSQQLDGLISSDGLLPAALYLEKARVYFGDSTPTWLHLPTLFWFDSSDAALHLACYIGLALSLLLCSGFARASQLFLLWIIYLSFNGVGQIFYGFGWEILLLEAGFLAIFLAPFRRAGAPPSTAVMWLYRWLLFRVIFGAGLIKLRGDSCWWDLSCMEFHYQTQPLPHILSWYWHQLPPFAHKISALATHLVEIVVPFFLFANRRWRQPAALIQIAFQVLLILSGNLSWLNYLTIALCFACLDDEFLRRFSPARLVVYTDLQCALTRPHGHRLAIYALCISVFYLSSYPIQNMVSPQQAMNRSFDTLRLVNSYGAFGHIGKKRYEIVLLGTDDVLLGPDAEWREYEFYAKPGRTDQHPAWVSPYHYRLDWQLWFAAMSDYKSHPWIVHLLAKLLHNNANTLTLLAHNPFPDTPPAHIRADLYEYEFTSFADASDRWWKRKHLGTYLGPLAKDAPALSGFLRHYGWNEQAAASDDLKPLAPQVPGL